MKLDFSMKICTFFCLCIFTINMMGQGMITRVNCPTCEKMIFNININSIC